MDPKVLAASKSPEAARILGAGVYGRCSSQRLKAGLTAALSDPEAAFSATERELIAQALDEQVSDAVSRRRTLGVKFMVTPNEYDQLNAAAAADHRTLSDYCRVVLFGDGKDG